MSYAELVVISPNYTDDPAWQAFLNLPIDLTNIDTCWSSMHYVYDWAIQFGIPLFQAYCK